ncbi:MAG: lipoyl synthase [Planctomycetes bacterium]|nr:lipoyl synthase [Planctomycetota bacterium]
MQSKVDNQVGALSGAGQKSEIPRRPSWLKVSMIESEDYRKVRSVVKENALHTVCEEALCPNRNECWSRGTATFMILGDICTRACGFCAVKTGKPTELDLDEPARVARAVKLMGIKFAVITGVDRDDQSDSGAGIYAATVREIRKQAPGVQVELLTGDFKAREELVRVVTDSAPEVFAHNLETVPRMSPTVRRQARHERSIATLRIAREHGMRTKTGLMLGLGERDDEIVDVMREAREVGVSIFTLGQYLSPTRNHLPVEKFYHPDEFARFKEIGFEIGFEHVESGPLVRSSYHAEKSAGII